MPSQPPLSYEYDPEAELLCTTIRCTAPKPMKRAKPAKIAKGKPPETRKTTPKKASR